MKCTCSRVDLHDALSAVARAVAVKPSTPVLAGIYLRADGTSLELQATDFSIGIIATIPANVEQSGSIVTSGKFLPAIVSKFAGDIVTLTSSDSALSLKSDAASFDLLTIDAADFPLIRTDPPTHSFRIHSDSLKSLIASTVFACSTGDSRPVFNGCLIDLAPDSIHFVATNSHRIAIASSHTLDPCPALRFIVHSATLRVALAILSVFSDTVVSVSYSPNSASFSIGNIFLTSRLIAGVFPAYDRVIPSTFSTTATLTLSDFRRAIDRLLILARESDYQSVILTFSHDGLAVSSDAHGIGSAIEHVDSAVLGDSIAVSLNVHYILDALKVIRGGDIMIGMNGALSPVAIRGTDGDSFKYVVTPLRTQ